MKKLFIIGVIILGQTATYAQENPATHFVCGQPTKVNFSVKFGGPWYRDALLFVDNDRSAFKKLLNDDELNLIIRNVTIDIATDKGSCKLGSILSCDTEGGFNLSRINYSYMIGGAIFGDPELISVNRELHVVSLNLKVIREYVEIGFVVQEFAKLVLEMKVLVANKVVVYQLEKTLGEFDPLLDVDRCEFKSSK